MLAILLAGCASPYTPPVDAGMPVPADWAESDPAPIALDLTEYWQLLGDPLLTQFVEQANASNLDLA